MAKNSIIIVEKNEGIKIPYSIGIGTNKIALNDELIINLEKYERDDPSHIDICMDSYKNLVMGVIPGISERYVAQIDIPSRSYTYEEISTIVSDGEETTRKIPIPFDISKCTLTLWALSEVAVDE